MAGVDEEMQAGCHMSQRGVLCELPVRLVSFAKPETCVQKRFPESACEPGKMSLQCIAEVERPVVAG